MSKRSYMSHITPLPAHVTRKQALALLHDHNEMIRLNPLVIGHHVTEAPPNATDEEAQGCTWYEITDIIHYLPGGAAKSEVSYKGGFYDLPYGLQTHVFAPAGVDLKALWKVGGNMPVEAPEPPEMGVEKPREGLYLREEVEIKCNVFLSNFVKRNLKKSHAVLVERLLEKVEAARATTANLDTSRPSIHHARSAPSTRAVSPISPHAEPFSPLSATMSQQSSQTSRTATPMQRDEPCLCESGFHDPMCPSYRYGAPPPRKRSPTDKASEPLTGDGRPPSRKRSPAPPVSGRALHKSVVDRRRPPRADQRNNEPVDIYSPAGSHPESNCSCSSEDHERSCQYYSAPAQQQAKAPATRTWPQAVKQRAKDDNNLGRVVWKLPSGNIPTVAFRSPQLFGEQAELTGNTVSTEHEGEWTDPALQSNSKLAKQTAANAMADLDGMKLAYWEAEGQHVKERELDWL